MVLQPSSSLSGRLVQISGLTAAYYLTGKLALLLAIPPGYATAVWPASGIALAGLLLLGKGAWPGIFLGSFLANIGTPFAAAHEPAMASAILLTAGIAAGATLQALLGAFLIRKYVGFPISLARIQDVFKAMALGGPFSCLVSATIGLICLLSAGTIQAFSVPSNLWTWWLGDTIGVLVVLPLVSAFRIELPHVEFRTRLLVILPICITAAITVLLFFQLRAGEWNRVQLLFERRTDLLAQAIKGRLNSYLDVLYGIEAFFVASEKVERREFSDFTRRFFLRDPGIQALEWAPRVSEAQRAHFQARAHREGYPEFRIKELNAEGRMDLASSRPEYYPVYYLEPYEGNETALGFDLASNQLRLEALNRARDSGAPISIAPIRLVQEIRHQSGVIIFLPVFKQGVTLDTQEARRAHLTGYVLGVFRVSDMVNAALKPLDLKGIVFRLQDETAPPGEGLLFSILPPSGETSDSSTKAGRRGFGTELHSQVPIEFAGRRWMMEFNPTAEYLTDLGLWEARAVLTGGLLFSSLLGTFLLVIAGRTAMIRRVVQERTSELSNANAEWAREITERRKTDEALQESEARHRAIVDNAVDGIITINEQAIVQSFNPAAEHIFGYRASEVIGRNVNMLQPEPFRSHHDGYVQNYLRTGQAKIIGIGREVTGRRHDGTTFPLDLSVSELRLGKKRLFTGILRDITERKQREEALRSSEERFNLAVLGSSDGVWDWNILSNEIYCSPRLKELLGYPEIEFESSMDALESRLHADDRQRVLNAVKDHLKDRRPFDIEFRVQIKSEEYRWFLVRGQAIWGENNLPVRMAGSLTDISVRKLAEEELRLANEKLQELDRLKSMFIASMSHELRTPLNSIIGFSSILFNEWAGPLNDEQKENLSTVVRTGKHLLALINDVIDVSKIEAGQLDIHVDPFDLHEVIEEAVTTLAGQAETQRLELQVENLHHPFRSDRLRLLQCVLNLLSNAIKYTQRGTIIVCAKLLEAKDTAPRWVEISVSDTGIGISKEDRSKIFQPFVRLDSPLKSGKPGTGLGLYLTRKLASEVLKGEAGFDSREGEGSRFFLTIPDNMEGL